MLIIINSAFYPRLPEMAGVLAGRFDGAVYVDGHQLARQQPGLEETEIFKEIETQVCTEKARGKEFGVVSYSFYSTESLKQLRVLLSRCDNEIYAFRLHFDKTAFATCFPGEKKDVVLKAYAKWLGQQEAGAQMGDMGYELLFDSIEPSAIVDAIWKDIHEPVELQEYQTNWPEKFACEQARILTALQGLALDVEHIGSTAIPGMIAKPILDILITVKRLPDTVKCIQPLRELGYAFIDYPQNTTRRFFRKGKPRSHHVHIVEKGSREEFAHIRFRDALLADEVLRREYLTLKHEALQQHKYRRALYGEKKGKLIARALAKFRDAE